MHVAHENCDMSIDVTRTRTLSEAVAEEIRVAMVRRRVSGAKLAKELGVSAAWVSYRLTGVQPIDLNDLERIASVLGVTAVDLFPRSRREVTVTDPLAPFVEPFRVGIPRQVGRKGSVDKNLVGPGSHYVRPPEPCGARR